jgi:hypothetical protein
MGIKLLLEFFQSDRRIDRAGPRSTSRADVPGRAQTVDAPSEPPKAQPMVTVDVRRLSEQQRMAREVLDQNRVMTEPLNHGQVQTLQVPGSLWEKLSRKRVDLNEALDSAAQNSELLLASHEVDRDRVEDLLVD